MSAASAWYAVWIWEKVTLSPRFRLTAAWNKPVPATNPRSRPPSGGERTVPRAPRPERPPDLLRSEMVPGPTACLSMPMPRLQVKLRTCGCLSLLQSCCSPTARLRSHGATSHPRAQTNRRGDCQSTDDVDTDAWRRRAFSYSRRCARWHRRLNRPRTTVETIGAPCA